ncbi:hypothetical protein M0R45_037427 [Rubus argutus]|uniref:Disease resistance protein RGA3 n=1 Tax=Rubus argutus TaxID=59490 RepID=A0AAW1W2D3_RUBAR
MAEALVHVLLQRLAMITQDKVQEEFKQVTGVKKQVNNLISTLEAIQAVLEDAEYRQVTEARVRRWLNQLNEVSYEMDDVLDEWITQVLKQQMVKQENQGENALVTTTNKKKVCFPFLSSSCFCFRQANHLIHCRDIAVRIKDLDERLALIDKEKQSFNFQNTTSGPVLPERQQTTSLPGDKTFGRDKEKNIILGKLLSEDSCQEKGVPSIIPIIGMGGMGKTTLAQLVYNDQTVKTYFDKRIWVCVSDPFEEIKIAKAIVEGLEKNSPSIYSNNLQVLLERILELIEGKKFLLVLDDVWSPKLGQWEELIKPLRKGAMGSRILVTTRKEEVATLMKATAQIIQLKQLSEEFCLTLFYYHAGIEISSESKMLQDIGEKIVKKCDGLPLAAKTLGSLMRVKKTIKEWQDVLSSKIWELEEIETHVFRPLLLSYHDLASVIKRCLLYCVTFPKDYVFDRDNLIELWMAQDYLNAKGSNEKKRNGQKYFENLVMRSFFQDFAVDAYGKTRCKMHDIVHDFLLYLTKNECYTVDYKAGLSERMEEANDKVHHLTLLHVRGRVSLFYFRNCKNLRSLAAHTSDHYAIDQKIIVQLKCLRTLNFGGSGSKIEEIPKEMGRLIHLRYIDLSESNMRELPDTMNSLYNLQTLRLVRCRRLRILDLGRLINLRHLYVDGCENLKLLRIERLKSLQTLDTFYVQSCCYEGNKLEDLKNVNELQGHLSIHIMGFTKSAKKAYLVNKAHLLHWRIVFQCRRWEMYPPVGREMLNGLQPHPGLESLTISCYWGRTLLTDWWSTLHSLRLLTLENCKWCKILPPLGQLLSLESLHVTSLDSLQKVGVEFLGMDRSDQTQTTSTFKSSFPRLKQLIIDSMSSLREWEGVDDPENNSITIMPCLSSLTISGCFRLKSLPDFLWKTPLQTLDISHSHMLEDVYGREGRGEEWAKISHIPNIKLGIRWIQQEHDQDTDRDDWSDSVPTDDD